MLLGAEIRTTQLNLMKFLKHKAPERRVFRGSASDATILSKRREKPGFVSSALRAASARAVSVTPSPRKTDDEIDLFTLLVLPWIERGLQQLGNSFQL
jgi:hypothetical protein